MIDRCKSYIDAGAEIVFPEALKDEAEFEKVRKSLDCYLLANMTEFGKSKLLDFKQLEELGYNIVIYPVTTQRLAMKSVEDGLRAIFADGHQNNVIDNMKTKYWRLLTSVFLRAAAKTIDPEAAACVQPVCPDIHAHVFCA